MVLLGRGPPGGLQLGQFPRVLGGQAMASAVHSDNSSGAMRGRLADLSAVSADSLTRASRPAFLSDATWPMPQKTIVLVAISCYFESVKAVGIKVLNSRLSEYVRLAASGETILVTDRDRVVAELGPLRETRSPILADAFLADAVRSGVLTPPTLAASGPPPRPSPVAPFDEVMAELDENRRDR